MKKEELRKAFEKATDGLRLHPDIVPELAKIIQGSGQESRFLSLFLRRMLTLREYGERAIQYFEEFERLDDRIYSVHFACGQFNIRILYSFLSDGTVLLHGFYKRSGKKKTDYQSAIPIARKRLEEMEGEGNE